jgi:hypothetical protein
MGRRIATLTAVLSLAMAGWAGAAESGVYAGVTSMKGVIRLTVRHQRLVRAFFEVTFFGSNCAVTGGYGNTSVPIRHNRFRVVVYVRHTKIDVHLTGHFTGSRVTGTLNGTDGAGCKTGKTTYQALR